jgi:hypothetical protein
MCSSQASAGETLWAVHAHKPNVLAMSSLFPRKTVADLAGVCDDIFAAAFLRSPLLSSINSFEDGRFLLVNDTFVQKTGYCREDILAKS